jgi:uncharacterized membrane protein/mono/diheme cytochrome c family protein
MPTFRGKINKEQARNLVAFVRSFVPIPGKAGVQKQQGPNSPSGFKEQFRRLQTEMDELERQSRELAKSSGERVHSRPPETSPGTPPSKPAAPAPRPGPSKPSAPAAADNEFFQQHCVKCHGADGTGSKVRRRQPEIPNFTDASWQARRSDAQLLASILDGKGQEMPTWREEITEDQAHRLVARVLAFASSTGKSGQGEQQTSIQAESTEAKPPASSSEKLIAWFGKFHPAAVHFPIALLTAAAVAEFLRLATGKSTFESVSRFCIWFGLLTAVGAAALGWSAASARQTDASWVLTAHRWLGTSTVACAGLVLILGEVSRRSAPFRIWFGITLFGVAGVVLVTGFFGGALVFGLDHYAWPP